MNLKELSVISLTMLMLSFMGILMCVSLLFGEDSEGGVVLLVFLLVAIVSQKKS